MKIILESTTKTVELNGVPARIWEGHTETGVKMHAYITRVAIDRNETGWEEFEKELQAQRIPSVDIEAIPTRLII